MNILRTPFQKKNTDYLKKTVDVYITKITALAIYSAPHQESL